MLLESFRPCLVQFGVPPWNDGANVKNIGWDVWGTLAVRISEEQQIIRSHPDRIIFFFWSSSTIGISDLHSRGFECIKRKFIFWSSDSL